MFNLFPDQIELIDGIRAKLGGGCKSLLVTSPTGSGKTVMACEIIAGAYKKGKTCFFVAPRRELIRQIHKTLSDFDIPHSFIAAGWPHDKRQKIFVCSTETLVRRLDVIPDIAVMDETHFGQGSLDKIITTFRKGGAYILGLSATPEKLSGKGLGCWYDDIIIGKSIRWLIDNKRLADYKLFAPNIPDMSGVRVLAGDYDKGELCDRMESDRVLVGNTVSHYKKYTLGMLGVSFGVSRKHSEILAQAYRDAGIPAMHIDGETPDDERVRISRAFAKRELLQLCNAELLSFGYDLASASGLDARIEVITDAQPTMSIAKQMQKWGRGLRYDPLPHYIFDHAGNVMRHGMPCQEREWTLADRKKMKRGDVEKTISVKQCPECFFCHLPSPQCPNCGSVYQVDYRAIKEVEGELSEVQIIAKKKNDRMEVGRARTMADLFKIQTERGYNRGWVWKMAQIKGIRG